LSCTTASSHRDPAFEQRQLDCDPLGTVDVLIGLLEAAWRRHSVASLGADPHSSLFVLHHRFPARPEVLWDWLTLPEFRQRYDPGVTAISGSADVDPRSVQFQCDHGAFTVLETVREWRPYEVCTRDTVIQPLGISLRVTWKLTPDENATRVTVAVGSRPAAGPLAERIATLEYYRPTRATVVGGRAGGDSPCSDARRVLRSRRRRIWLTYSRVSR
jgi:polyketide cyclase/dehydrase/lipid transport protein